MVKQTTAYKSDTGKLFLTKEEAEKDEIRDAAEVLGGVEPSHLTNVGTGNSTCQRTREAILTLADAIRARPIAMPSPDSR